MGAASLERAVYHETTRALDDALNYWQYGLDTSSATLFAPYRARMPPMDNDPAGIDAADSWGFQIVGCECPAGRMGAMSSSLPGLPITFSPSECTRFAVISTAHD
jgi:hypothetical protein